MGKDNAEPGAEPGVGARPSTPTTRSHGYPKSVRLRKRREFLAVQRSGERFHGNHFLAVVMRRKTEPGRESPRGRVGITITKKIGNAVTRNRIKRLVREHIRQDSWLDRPGDTVLIAKRSAADLTCLAEVAADLSSIAASIASSIARATGAPGRRDRRSASNRRRTR